MFASNKYQMPRDRERIFLSPPHMCGKELRYVQDALNSNYIAPVGPQVDAFEKEFCEYTGIRHAIAVASGTAAIHLALRNLNVGNGDEVFASTLTFIGGVSPIVFLGATVVLIDCDKETWNMDPSLLEEELARSASSGRLPKAVVPTDLYGQCCNLGRIKEICEKYKVPVVCDSAEAFGASYRNVVQCDKGKQDEIVHAGVGANAAVFSFNGNKIISTSGGGMLASDDKDFIAKARFLAHQAREDFPYYQHSEIGYNYCMSNIIAAIGRGQLECIEERVRRKREIYDYYVSSLSDLPGIAFMPEASYGDSTRWLTVVVVDPGMFGQTNEALRLALESENIESRPVWKPMHQQPVFNICSGVDEVQKSTRSLSSWPARKVGGAVADELFEKGLCLPSGTALTDGDLERIVGIIRNNCKNSP